MITSCPDAFQAERESTPHGAGLNKSQLKPSYIGITEKPERGNNAEQGTKVNPLKTAGAAVERT